MINDEVLKAKVAAFLQDQLNTGDFRAKAYAFDDTGKRRYVRDFFSSVTEHIDNFLNKKTAVRWITMYGLRGTGKTTLLAQLYDYTKVGDRKKLFLSVDEAASIFGVTLIDILLVYEELLGKPFEQLEEPVFLFLDEVQYDSQWGIFLKTIYDRARNVFIVATGSSALSLQANADVARRSIFKKLYPMSFVEFVSIKKQKPEPQDLSKPLQEIIFDSENAEEVFGKLKKLEPQINKYWLDIHPRELDQYLRYGTLPFMVALNNEAMVYDQIKKTMERVVNVDIQRIMQFAADTVAKIPMLLYAIAESDQLSLTSVSKSMGISRPVLIDILDTLVRTDTIWRLYPHGSHIVQVRHPSKYLFMSAAFRSMYFNLTSSTRVQDEYKGKLLEDIIGLYLHKIFGDHPANSVTYDSATGGADFIVRSGKNIFVVEVGWGNKSFKQVETTMRKKGINAKYGIVVSQSPLAINEKKDVVRIPLQHFLLL